MRNWNEKEIEQIINQETKICNQRWYLGASLVLALILVIGISANAIIGAVRAPESDVKADQIAAVQIIIAGSLFVIAFIFRYFYDRKLSKDLDKLVEQKKALF